MESAIRRDFINFRNGLDWNRTKSKAIAEYAIAEYGCIGNFLLDLFRRTPMFSFLLLFSEVWD